MKAHFLCRLAAGLSLLLTAMPVAAQLPTGASVVAGQVAIDQSGGAMTLTQASRNAIINWQSFNIGTDNRLLVQQPGADAAMLARVTGGDPSQLLGSLQANGRFYLINPQGIIIGRDAVIDTAAFAASTLDVSNQDFLAGAGLTFKGDGTGSVINLGTIKAREGNVLLLARTVSNAGTINAPQGTAALAAGTEVYLATPDSPNLTVKTDLTAPVGADGVDNSGVIRAAQAQLEAAGGSLYALAVNQTGVVQATGSAVRDGRVLLTAAGGTVGVSGDVTARNADGAGGEILVGGDLHGANPDIANATRTVVTATARLDAGAATPSAAGGHVIVWSDDATRFLGSLNAAGAGGGFAEVSGRHFLDFNPVTSAQLGANGTLLLDPDALVISTAADSGTSTSGSNPFVFGATTEPANLNVTTLENQLALTNVTLDTSTSNGDITVNSPVAWSTNNTLRLQAGGSINLNASLTGGATSTLALYPGRDAQTTVPESGWPDLSNNGATLAAGSTITVGTLVYGANAQSAPTGYTVSTPAGVGPLTLDGDARVNTLELDLSGGTAGVTTNGSNTAIANFRTSGSGNLDGVYLVNNQGGLNVSLTSAASTAPYLQFITPGALALQSGSSLNFASSGTILLASTGGAFTNQAGAGAFGANARFLIYSNSPGLTTLGGLTGTAVYNHPYSITDDYSGDTISRVFYTVPSGLPILTYTADNLTRTYGSANAALTFSVTGWQSGVTNDVTGAPALSTTATQSSGVGSYTISIGPGTLASSNYDFSFAPGVLTVNPAPLTITADSYSRRVNLANPPLGVSYSGFVLGQDSSVVSGLNVSTTATQASPIGTYPITASGASAPNYTINYVPGVLTVTDTAPLTITADSFNRIYGSPNPTFTATYTGLVGGDTSSVVTGLQFSTAATQSSGVGTYTITPFGATAPGYTISYVDGQLSITPAPLTIAIPNQSRTYGDANSFTVDYNGLVNGDTSAVVSGLQLTTSATPTSNVGTYGITASGAAAANYSITYAQGSLTIVPAPLTVSIDNASRHYGDPDPAFSYTVSGLKNGDSAASMVSVTGLASLASATSGIGDYGIIGTGWSNSANYTVSTMPGTLTITPRPLTITADSFSRVYGDPNPAFTATFAGLASFDTPASFGDLGLTTQATTSSGVGSWGITFTKPVNPNYAITTQFGTLTITPAPLTIAIADASRTYGQSNPTFTADILGLRNNDTTGVVSGLTLATAATRSSDAGTYAITGSGSAINYTLNFVPGTLTVDRAAATISANSTSRTFGDPTTSFLASFSGFLPSDLTLAQSDWQVNNPDNPLLAAGTYAVGFTERLPEIGAALRKNYAITITPGSLTIARRVFDITIPNVTAMSTAVPSTFAVDTSTPVPFGPAFTVTAKTLATDASPPGTYAITPVITGDAGITLADLNQYYDFRPTLGVLTLTMPQPVHDTVQLDPGIYLQNTPTTTINTNVQINPATVTVNQPPKITVAAPTEVPYYTPPLTKADFAHYFESFDGQTDSIRASLAGSYKSFLGGAGKKGSAYEAMTAGARQLLADWMSGKLTTSALSALISSGNADASTAFGFILPTLVNRTRAKSIDKMTPMDREVLGRLADLTAKRRSDTILIAQQKYAAMLKANAKNAQSEGLETLFLGPGDFKSIVQSATQDAIGKYLGATLGGGAGGAASASWLGITAVANVIFPNSGGAALAAASGVAGPAIAATMAVVLAVRAVQVGDSIKNEQDFNNLMNSWHVGQQITSIADLKSPAMDNDMKLSTLMLSAELLKPGS